jgi:hypothetical protein
MGTFALLDASIAVHADDGAVVVGRASSGLRRAQREMARGAVQQALRS